MTEQEKPDISININTSNNDNKKTTTEVTEITEKITNNNVTINDERVTVADKNNGSNNDVKKNKEFSECLRVGGQKVLVVKNAGDIVSGDNAPNCCLLGSPEHVRLI